MQPFWVCHPLLRSNHRNILVQVTSASATITSTAPTRALKLLEYNCPGQLPMTLRFRSMIRPVRLNGMPFWGLLLLLCTHLVAQGVAVPGDPCKPVSARTQEIGCWILADNPVGQLTNPQVFWHLDAYPTRVAAQADKGREALLSSRSAKCG
jgi:hypothetical protein